MILKISLWAGVPKTIMKRKRRLRLNSMYFPQSKTRLCRREVSRHQTSCASLFTLVLYYLVTYLLSVENRDKKIIN